MIRETTVLTAIVLGAVLAYGTVRAQDDILEQQKELQGIQKEVEQSQKRLDSLKNAEHSVLKQISAFDQKISSDRKVISRLTRELGDLRTNVKAAEDGLANSKLQYELTRRRFLGNIRQFYFVTRDPESTLVTEPNREMEMQRQVCYLKAVAGFESAHIQKAQQFLAESEDQLTELTGQTRMVANLKKEKERNRSLQLSQKEREEQRLDRLKREKMAESDRMLMLQQAAQEMEEIIARLEEARRENEFSQMPEASAFASLQGQLLMPFNGKIVVPFGVSIHPINKLKSYSPGIVIEGRAAAPVRVVASGEVARAGYLRGYGNFVIINHDNQYYTTYAGLEKIAVSEGQWLQAGTRLGISGSDGRVRFELRKGREPLDPVEWIKFESL